MLFLKVYNTHADPYMDTTSRSMMVTAVTRGVYPEGQPPPHRGMGKEWYSSHPVLIIGWPSSPHQHSWECLGGGSIGTGHMLPFSQAGLWYSSHQRYLALQWSENTEASHHDLPRPLFSPPPTGWGTRANPDHLGSKVPIEGCKPIPLYAF